MLEFPSFFLTSYETDTNLIEESMEKVPDNSTLKIAYSADADGLKTKEIQFTSMDIVPDGFIPENRN